MPTAKVARLTIGLVAAAFAVLALMAAPSRSQTDDGPRIVSFSYGRHQPAGVRIGTLDPDGSVVAVEIEELAPRPGTFAELDGGCIDASKNGQVQPWLWHTRLRPGRYRFRVTLTSATCGTAPQLQTRTFTRRLRVRRR